MAIIPVKRVSYRRGALPPKRTCIVAGCTRVAKCFSPLCSAHKRRKVQLSNPLAKAVQAFELRADERRIRQALRRLSEGTLEKFRRSALEAANNLNAYCLSITFFDAGLVSKSKHAQLAARALLRCLSQVDSLQLVIRQAALAILYDEQPRRFLQDDEVYRANVLSVLRAQAKVVDKVSTVRTGPKAGRRHNKRKDVPIRARVFASQCILETFSGHIAFLKRLGKEVSELNRIESVAVRCLMEQGIDEIRARIRIANAVNDRVQAARRKAEGSVSPKLGMTEQEWLEKRRASRRLSSQRYRLKLKQKRKAAEE